MTSARKSPWQTCEECGAKMLGYWRMVSHSQIHPGMRARQRLTYLRAQVALDEQQLAYYHEVWAALDGQPVGPLLKEKLQKEWERGGTDWESLKIEPLSWCRRMIKSGREQVAKYEAQLASELEAGAGGPG